MSIINITELQVVPYQANSDYPSDDDARMRPSHSQITNIII